MRSLFFAAASILVTGCSANSEGPANQAPTVPSAPSAPSDQPPADTSTPRFESTACRFIVPKSAEGTTVKCGDVIVAENRAKANGRTIKIHVAVFPGKKDLPPIFELIGGPGGGADPTVGLLAAHEKSTMDDSGFLLTRGDYVIFDQRGIGRSDPNLTCAEEELAARSPSMLGVMTKCRDRLVGQGIDLGAYTTQANALDVDDIRKVLGYDKIDLHAISYGTLLALEVMRQKPEHIHSVIVDGVLPPEAKLISDTPRTIDEDLTRIFTACSKQDTCNAAFPDLDGSLATLKQKLDEKPFDSDMGPFDFYAFTGMLGQSMYEPDGIRQIPLWVHDFATRGQAAFDDWVKNDPAMNPPQPNDNPLAQEVFDALDEMMKSDLEATKYLDVNSGMFTSVTCSDSGQYETEADADAELAKIRPMMQDIEREDIKEQLAICAMWPKSEKRATTKQAVTSTIPTLSLGGEFDPVTPSYWAEQVTKTLSNSQFIFQKALGHGSMDSCAQSIKLAFFGDASAKPDATCAGARAMKFATTWLEASQPASFHSVKRPKPIRPIRPATRPVWITGR